MKYKLIFLVLVVMGCQSKPEVVEKEISDLPEVTVSEQDTKEENSARRRFRNSISIRESDNYISKLEEIPDRDSNAYKLTITSKNGKTHFSKILDTRPQASSINYCNDLYTVVGFSCGGPCYSQVFVFTDETRPMEQFAYSEPWMVTLISSRTSKMKRLKSCGFTTSIPIKKWLSKIQTLVYGNTEVWTRFMLRENN